MFYQHLVAFPDYFRGPPQIDDIDYEFIPSDSSRELAFRSGEHVFRRRDPSTTCTP